MILTTGAMQREADRHAIEDLGVPSTLLMERAARALAAEAASVSANKRAAVFCGGGNNGGDGIGAARRLAILGWEVRVFLLSERLSDDSAEMLRRLRELRLDAEPFRDCGEIKDWLGTCGVVIDAMLGTGLKRPMEGDYAKAAELMAGCGAVTVSADIASGVDSDTGLVPGAAVRADVTVTFAAPKIGQFVEPGSAYSGRVVTADIGIEVPDDSRVRAVDGIRMPARDELAHKGDFGKVLIIAGSRGYTGAPVLAASAAVRAGAGLVWLGVPECIYPIVAESCAEVMPFPLPCGADGAINEAAVPEIINRLKDADCVLSGPGMRSTDATRSVISAILDNSAVPVVLDADALNAVSGDVSILRKARSAVITPHAGEFARLGGSVEGGRVAGALELASATGAAVVLKGHTTVTAFPDGDVFVNTTGNAGMACGGSGDVLSGVAAALSARFDLKTAVPSAVWLHGRAGDLAAAELGEDFMKPTDVTERLSAAFEETY
ncbi:MAG: NAD(P)H-hydrate dehydratase [Oscillospiraceae bacterium]|nr:NAD(P)H-hydrate dehydratase [Oscillospiraceae bacterium]